jgi:hypothetical protein
LSRRGRGRTNASLITTTVAKTRHPVPCRVKYSAGAYAMESPVDPRSTCQVMSARQTNLLIKNQKSVMLMHDERLRRAPPNPPSGAPEDARMNLGSRLQGGALLRHLARFACSSSAVPPATTCQAAARPMSRTPIRERHPCPSLLPRARPRHGPRGRNRGVTAVPPRPCRSRSHRTRDAREKSAEPVPSNRHTALPEPRPSMRGQEEARRAGHEPATAPLPGGSTDPRLRP